MDLDNLASPEPVNWQLATWLSFGSRSLTYEALNSPPSILALFLCLHGQFDTVRSGRAGLKHETQVIIKALHVQTRILSSYKH